MDAVEPFCPICRLGFMKDSLNAVRLICNHIVCTICLEKLRLDNCFRCYFEGAITLIGSEMYLSGFSDFLSECKIQVMTLSLRSGSAKLDQALMSKFNISCDRMKIPCRNANCSVENCMYDHTGRFYKKAVCPFAETCPNSTGCIFLHPWEQAQGELPDTPKPASQVYASSQSFDQSPASYQGSSYSSPTLPNMHQSHSYSGGFYSQSDDDYTGAQLRTLAFSQTGMSGDYQPVQQWQCLNCGVTNTGTQCFQCTCYRPS